eukprot:CFRG5524T1
MARGDAPTIILLSTMLFQIILWWVCLTITRMAQFKDAGGFSNYLKDGNRMPRDHQSKLVDMGRRAKAAMDNNLEGCVFLYGAVLGSIVIRGPLDGSWVVASLCLILCVLRIAHLFFYLTDQSTKRSYTYLFTGPIVIAIMIVNVVDAAA